MKLTEEGNKNYQVNYHHSSPQYMGNFLSTRNRTLGLYLLEIRRIVKTETRH